jgi:DNA-binding MarR family transcriptional regulator
MPEQSADAERLRIVAARLSRWLRTTKAGAQLTPSESSVLFAVARHGSLGLGELARLEGLNPTMLSRITAGLCERGLIERQARSDDRRAAVVSATPAGKRLRERIRHERTLALQAQLERLAPEERDDIWSALPALEHLAALLRDQWIA